MAAAISSIITLALVIVSIAQEKVLGRLIPLMLLM
jgi:hypothetical protein